MYNTKCIKYYTIVCDVDRTYIIKFTSGNLIKTLMVSVTKSGTFYLDVDFNKKLMLILSLIIIFQKAIE